MRAYDFLLAGVGGQGTLLASSILAEVGLCAGYDVKKSEVHGMAQRGGSVSSHVRWGEVVRSPLIATGSADIMVAFERCEALRYLSFLRPGGKAIVSDHVIMPVTVTTGNATYPSKDQILATLHKVTAEVALVPAIAAAEELGNVRVHNVVLLGALSRFVPVGTEVWEHVIEENVPQRTVELNKAAFARGRSL